MELRRRLAHAAAKSAQLRGVEGALAAMFESKTKVSGFAGVYVGFAGVIVLYILAAAWPSLQSGGLLAAVLTTVQIGSTAIFVLAIPVSMMLATFVGRIRYRREIRPSLLARPPPFPGAPAGCRVCGAALEATSGTPSCRYCHTVSIVSADVQYAVTSGADAQADFHRKQAMMASRGTARLSSNMTRSFFLAMALVYVGLGGCVAGSSYVVTRLVSAK
jgi:hypothetical protein